MRTFPRLTWGSMPGAPRRAETPAPPHCTCVPNTCAHRCPTPVYICTHPAHPCTRTMIPPTYTHANTGPAHWPRGLPRSRCHSCRVCAAPCSVPRHVKVQALTEATARLESTRTVTYTRPPQSCNEGPNQRQTNLLVSRGAGRSGSSVTDPALDLACLTQFWSCWSGCHEECRHVQEASGFPDSVWLAALMEILSTLWYTGPLDTSVTVIVSSLPVT